MSRDYPMSSEEHYQQYFSRDPIDWEYHKITHEQLLEDSFLRFEEGIRLMTDTELGDKIKQVKLEIAMENSKLGFVISSYKEDYTAQELGEEWRQCYQNSFYSQ